VSQGDRHPGPEPDRGACPPGSPLAHKNDRHAPVILLLFSYHVLLKFFFRNCPGVMPVYFRKVLEK